MAEAGDDLGQYRVRGHGRMAGHRRVGFTFDGRRLHALEGDTLAAALLANGIHLAGRSFKYHRPRGILAAGPEEPNALIDIARDHEGAPRSQPNVRAGQQEVFDGMVATSQNRWPGLAFDMGAVNDALGRFFPAGFYYKTFMWPRSFWDRVYEPVIRRAAGLGQSPDQPDPDHYANRFAHCDVLVVGGGPAGARAALAAARAGRSVLWCDENAGFGGSMRADPAATIEGRPALDWIEAAAREVAGTPGCTVLARTTAFGMYTQTMASLAERLTDHLARPEPETPRERLWQVRAGEIVLAQGAIERHLVFPGNDRPGILLAGAARLFLHEHGVIPGRNVAVYTACDSAWEAAFDLHAAGCTIPVIVDARRDPSPDLLARAASLGIRVLTGQGVTATRGRLRVREITVQASEKGAAERIAVDCLLMSGGWTPSVHLHSMARGRLAFDEANGRFLPEHVPEAIRSVGACAGTTTLAQALHQDGLDPLECSEEASMEGMLIGAALGAGPASSGKAFVDFQNDVTAKDIRLAVREGFRSIEHVKRYTTNGMATDQGKLSNMHGLAIAAETLGKPIPEVGLTTFRQPFTPVTFGTLVGHARGALFDPIRRTPIHAWAEAHGADFEDVGQWKRAWYYPRRGETMHEAVARECLAVRNAAGIFDASTLGKIEVVGPDAAAFLNLLYTNAWDTLAPGRCRYGLMLREDGFIYDDGVVARLAEDRFHVTTTTGGAPRVLNHMEDYLQTEFPHLKVWLTSVSEQWAVIAVQGPRAKEIVTPLVEDIDVDAMPFMSVREGRICGVPTRLMAVSFTGEAGFEINVPADHGQAVWEAVWARGEPLGLTPYGTETMHVLRAEKGFIIVGQDTDGTVTPDDAGLSWMVSKKKPDFVGKRGLARPDLMAEGRRQLVGLLTRDPNTVLEEGAQVVDDPNQPVPMRMIGHVTSSYRSASLGRSIALALVENGRARKGQVVHIPMPDGSIAAEIADTVFLAQDKEAANG